VVRNLRVYNNKVIKKLTIHKLINLLKKELNFTIKNLEISFVNSSEIIQLNSKYLHHKYSTDIITFDYSKPDSFLEGEILISLSDALDNSKKFRTPIKEELIRLVIHGVLHLLGYNDEKISEQKVMKTKENTLLRKYKFLFE
jgi:probable rRNA maturation factor